MPYQAQVYITALVLKTGCQCVLWSMRLFKPVQHHQHFLLQIVFSSFCVYTAENFSTSITAPVTPALCWILDEMYYWCVCVCVCIDMVLDHQEAAHELDDSVRVKVREALLKRHHHQSDKRRSNLLPMVKSLTDSGRKQSEPHCLDKTGETFVHAYMCIQTHWMSHWLTRSLCFCLSLTGHVTSSQPPPLIAEVKNGAGQDNGQVDLSKVPEHNCVCVIHYI